MAFAAADGPEFLSLMIVPRPGYEALESTDIRLKEALLEKCKGIAILVNDLLHGKELETLRREQGLGGLSALWFLRVIYGRIAPEGSAAGERARNTDMITRLVLDTNDPLGDLNSFMLRIAKAKTTCLQGSTEPAIVSLINSQCFNKLKSQIELRNIPRLGHAPTFYEFGYSGWL